MPDETKPTPAPVPAPAPAPRFPLLRQVAQIAIVIGLSYISARFGIPVPAPTVPLAPATLSEWPEVQPTVKVEVCDHPKAQTDGTPAISGKTDYQPYQLVRLKAENLKPGAAVLWRVSPRAGVDRATTAGDLCEFVAVPGSYDVELLVISKAGEGLSTQEVFTRVVIGTPKVEPKPEPKPDTKPEPEKQGQGKLDPPAALARIQFALAGGKYAGCTATVIGPRRADGRWDILTANHCIAESGGVGAKGSMKLKDGRVLPVRVVVREATADLAWMITEASDVADMPYANLSATNPAAGVKVWHAGYGVDVPGNREDGEVQVPETSDGQTRFYLSVSQGDSGGGVLRSDTNEVVSTVCCTAGLARKAQMLGASVQSIRRARPGVVRLDELPEPDPVSGSWLAHVAALAF